jgi:putative copper resistance protein D
MLSGAALATLAWGGHGTATEGPMGNVHLAADIAHILAAAAWFGALVAFFWLLFRPGLDLGDAAALRAALARFSKTGSCLVAAIILTGLVNFWVLVGIDNLGALFTTLYGQLLLAKLALFAAMIGLAATNRFRLTPALGRALIEERPERAIAALRISLTLETGFMLAILALVAWLGTLEPIGGV